MSNSQALTYWQQNMGKSVPHTVEFSWTITGAGTYSEIVVGQPVLQLRAAASSQAQIDNFLGTTSEFNYALLGSTQMGTDAIAFIVNMGGQAAKAVYAECSFWSEAGYNMNTIEGSDTDPLVQNQRVPPIALADTLTPKYALGANGNLAAAFVLTGLDAATVGMITARFAFISK